MPEGKGKVDIMELLHQYIPQTSFDSYEDFQENFALNVPENFDFARDIVDKWAVGEPEKTALLYCNDEGEETRFTFAQISSLSKRMAAYLLSLGLRKGDRVLTLLRRRYEYWILAVAMHRIGVVAVPASIQLTKKDIVYRINLAKVRMLVAIDDIFVRTQLDGLKEKCPTLEHIAIIGDKPESMYLDFNREYMQCDEYQEYSGLANQDEMIIYFTSGTSGYPKMAVHNRTYPLGHIMTAKYMQRVQNNGLHLTQADSGWAKFGWGNIYGQWICGSAVLAYDPVRFDGKHLLYIMERYKPTSLCVPPTMYRILMRDGLAYRHVSSIKWFSTAGEPLAGEINRAFYEITGQYIHEGYGQSEGTPICCSFEWLDIRPSAMGKPSPLYDVMLINENGERCQKGEHGEVVIRVGENQCGQVGLLTAYYTEEGFLDPVRDGIYHTGDVAYEDDEGYYWSVSRNDDMIKSSGYRIGPFEIESVLNTHPQVKESAIVGRPDAIRGQIVCAVVVLHDGCRPSEELTKELQKYVKENTAPYKYPRKIEYVSELPKTTSGKIMRSALKWNAERKSS